jgi:hypothetical protein
VQVNAASKIEDPFDRSSDLGENLEADHEQ